VPNKLLLALLQHWFVEVFVRKKIEYFLDHGGKSHVFLVTDHKKLPSLESWVSKEGSVHPVKLRIYPGT
jgi:hypothetical protein